MGEAEERSRGSRSGRGADPPLTVELLADLQAGLLDDDAAARVRRQVRADPEAEADAARAEPGAPRCRRRRRRSGHQRRDPPPEVIARISAALRSTDGPESSGPGERSARHTRPGRASVPPECSRASPACARCSPRSAVGTAALRQRTRALRRAHRHGQHITVSDAAHGDPAVAGPDSGLLGRQPDYGPPQARCPAHSTTRRGGPPASAAWAIRRPRRCSARGRSRSTPAPAVLLVLPGDTPDNLAVFAVALELQRRRHRAVGQTPRSLAPNVVHCGATRAGTPRLRWRSYG